MVHALVTPNRQKHGVVIPTYQCQSEWDSSEWVLMSGGCLSVPLACLTDTEPIWLGNHGVVMV